LHYGRPEYTNNEVDRATVEQTVYLLCRAVGTDNVLDLVGVWILKAQAAHAKPHPVVILGTETIHHGNCLTLQLQH